MQRGAKHCNLPQYSSSSSSSSSYVIQRFVCNNPHFQTFRFYNTTFRWKEIKIKTKTKQFSAPGLDALNGRVFNAGTVVYGDVLLSELLAPVNEKAC
jgi:hypothetical protein